VLIRFIVNTIVNILLVAAKAVAVLYSASISLTASLVDSALDLLSTFIILGTSWAIGVQTDKHKVGREASVQVLPCSSTVSSWETPIRASWCGMSRVDNACKIRVSS
jgi:hypothetical protein